MANTTNSATHAGSCKMCSTRPFMPLIFTHNWSSEPSKRHKRVSDLRKMSQNNAAWFLASRTCECHRCHRRPIDDRTICRGGLRVGEVCSTKKPRRQVYV